MDFRSKFRAVFPHLALKVKLLQLTQQFRFQNENQRQLLPKTAVSGFAGRR
jgi:hypothetical protein